MALLVQTQCNRPCYPCPLHVPHPSPLVSPLLLPILLHVPLCPVEAIPTVPVNVLLLLAVAIGSRHSTPPPPFSNPLSLLFFLTCNAPCALAFLRPVALLAPMRGSKYITQISPLASLHHKYKPPIGLQTSDDLTWSNGRDASGTYLDMIDEYKKGQEGFEKELKKRVLN